MPRTGRPREPGPGRAEYHGGMPGPARILVVRGDEASHHNHGPLAAAAPSRRTGDEAAAALPSRAHAPESWRCWRSPSSGRSSPFAGSRRFDSYLQQVQSKRNAAVVGVAPVHVQEPATGWEATAIYALSQVATFNNVDVAVYDPNERLLFTVQGRHTGFPYRRHNGITAVAPRRPRSAAPTSPSRARRSWWPASRSVGPTSTRPGAPGPRPKTPTRAPSPATSSSPRPSPALFALLLSLLVSRRIAGPLEELTDALATSPPATWTCACRREVTTRSRRWRRRSTPWRTGSPATNSGGAT